jgi:hypothetical protein
MSEIGDEMKRAAILAAIALTSLCLAGVALVLGLILWIDEWAFGSIGWGALHGLLLLLAVAVLVALTIIDLGWRRAGAALLIGLAFGLAVAATVGLDWRHVGRGSDIGPAWLPAVLGGMAVLGLLCGLLGGYLGRARGIAFGVPLGAVLGALFGLLGAAQPGLRIAAAVGLAAGLLVLPIWAASLVFRRGVDTAKLKARFWPAQTIETTKETIEWVRAQMPLARKS